MNNIFSLLIAVLFWMFSVQSNGAAGPELQQRFDRMTEGLRCLVCQNESIAESNAPLAKDLRREVYRLMEEGYSDDEVKEYVVSRYGQFILFKPAFTPSTYGLWVLPFLILIVGLLIVFLLPSRQKPPSSPKK